MTDPAATDIQKLLERADKALDDAIVKDPVRILSNPFISLVADLTQALREAMNLDAASTTVFSSVQHMYERRLEEIKEENATLRTRLAAAEAVCEAADSLSHYGNCDRDYEFDPQRCGNCNVIDALETWRKTKEGG